MALMSERFGSYLQRAGIGITSAIVMTVGATGDHSTINDALTEAKKYRPLYLSKGRSIEIKLKSDYTMAEQVFVVQDDLSYLTISMDTGVTEVPIQRSAINQNNGGQANNWRTGVYTAFCAMRGGALPFLKALFSFDDSGTGYGTTGVYVFEGGRAVIARLCGVKNAGWRGLYVDGGYCYARQTVWSGAGFAGGVEGAAGGIRGSNQAVCMVRQVDCTNCYSGAYFSDCIVNVSDSDFSDCENIGISSNAGANVWGGGVKADRCGTAGFHATNGGKMTLGESSNTDGVFPSAQDCVENAVFADNGGDIFLMRPTLSSTTGHAISNTNSTIRLSAGTVSGLGANSRGLNSAEGGRTFAQGATITGGSSEWAVRLFNGSEAMLYGATLEGGSGEVQCNGGSKANVGSTTRFDGTSPIRSNVLGGEFSPLGELTGVDQRTTLITTEANITLSSSSSPLQIITAAFTATRDVTLYDSTNWGWKRHTIVHAGSGSAARIYLSGGTVAIAALQPGESISIVPNGSGGWAVVGSSRLTTRRSQSNTTYTLTPASGEFIRSSASITVDRDFTMYSAGIGPAARDHTFSRPDTGAGYWVVKDPGGTTIVLVGAGEWATVAPLADGSGWYVAKRGRLRPASGATAARPAHANVDVGFDYFDTTLNKPIWSNGTEWRDAAGTVV